MQSYNDVEHTESIERYRTLLKQSDHPQIVRLKCYILLAGFLYQDAGGVQWNMEAAKKACNEMCEAYHAGTIKLTEEDVEYIMVQERIVDDAIKDTKEAWFEFRTSDVIMRCISRVQTKTRTRGVTNVEKILGTSWK